MVIDEIVLEYFNSLNGVSYDKIKIIEAKNENIFSELSRIGDTDLRLYTYTDLSYNVYNNYIISQRKKKIERIRHGK